MIRKNILGVVVVAGIAIGVLLSKLFPSFGLGSGTNLGANDRAASSSVTSDDVEGVVLALPEEPEITPAKREPVAETEPETHDVLHVLVDDRSFAYQWGARQEGTFQNVELDQLVELAKSATGDSDGIRIKVSRRESARASAEVLIKDALEQAGISPDAIRWSNKLLP